MTQRKGLCLCGCGQLTAISPRDVPKYGYVAGEPRRFVKGHARKSPHPEYRVDPTTGCWIWQRYVNRRTGYPYIDKYRAHRVVYERHRGPIPKDLVLDHLCRNKRCVNPDHLEAVLPAQNTVRGHATKLNDDLIAAILAAPGTQRAIGERFGLSQSTVGRVKSGYRVGPA